MDADCYTYFLKNCIVLCSDKHIEKYIAYDRKK